MMNTTNTEPLLIGVKEIARALNIAEITVRKKLCKGDFPVPSFKVGRRRLFRRSDLQAFIQNAA